MEDVKERLFLRRKRTLGLSFNPCFNGRCKRTIPVLGRDADGDSSFNPCFNGRCKRTIFLVRHGKQDVVVSILVLMEDVKEQIIIVIIIFFIFVSILVLMEDVKEH